MIWVPKLDEKGTVLETLKFHANVHLIRYAHPGALGDRAHESKSWFKFLKQGVKILQIFFNFLEEYYKILNYHAMNFPEIIITDVNISSILELDITM